VRVLGLIPARAGSKGVPRKNTKLLGGKPLLQYAAEAAHKARRLSRTVLSTDDEEIAEVGRRIGLEVPFRRPRELARDDTPMLAVVRHALLWVETNGDRFDAVCLLQPTNPFRRSADIDGCVELLEESQADSVATVLDVPPEHNPHWVYFSEPDGRLRLSTGEQNPLPRRQELPAAFHREGSVYVTRRDVVMEENSLYGQKLVGYLVNGENRVNIDTPEDWERAEFLLGQGSALTSDF
jgi:CMP-N,N'-diacetyllegionaminic acid synthase